jgi:hypothetical protein
MKHICSLLVIVIGALACDAYAHTLAEWEFVSGNNRFNYYYDSATIYKRENIVKVWTLYDHFQLDTSHNAKPHMSMMILGEFDCKKEVHRTLYTSTYSEKMGKGEMIEKDGSHELTSKWHSVSPVSFFYTLMRVACK